MDNLPKPPEENQGTGENQTVNLSSPPPPPEEKPAEIKIISSPNVSSSLPSEPAPQVILTEKKPPDRLSPIFLFFFFLVFFVFLATNTLLFLTLKGKGWSLPFFSSPTPTETLSQLSPSPTVFLPSPTSFLSPSPPAKDKAVEDLLLLEPSDQIASLEKDLQKTSFSSLDELILLLDKEMGIEASPSAPTAF